MAVRRQRAEPYIGDVMNFKKSIITVAIVLGVAFGTGCVVFGICAAVMDRSDEEYAAFVALGSTLLAGSLAAVVAHAAGGFRDWDDDEP